MGKHISKLERQKNLQEKQAFEKQIKIALEKAAKMNESFLAIINEALDPSRTGNYWSNARFRFFMEFLGYNQKRNKKEVFKKWIENLVFLTEKLESKNPRWFKDIYFLGALIQIAKYRSLWIRPLEDWKPKTKSEHERFKELIAFLFAKYAFPPFLNYIFFYQEDFFFIRDFIFLAQGGSIKHINSTIPLSQKMKVEFMRSPEGFRVFEAFRHAQVLGLGGDELLAHRIAYSWLGRKEKRDETFWEKFIPILIAGGMFNYDKIGELIDYVRHELNENKTYTLKGRTLTSLMRQSDLWHEGLTFTKEQKMEKFAVWKPLFSELFEVIEGVGEKANQYKMVELLSNKELMDEGNKMNHCVATYSSYCSKGRTRIVSLRKYQCGFEMERLATIEVNLASGRVVQAKYRFNKPISEKAKSLLTQWVDAQGFRIDKYL
ncbi:PcfJ domain-containing protein [Emticicia sp. BO119]|uniref:PcfJ domain-containing protein n=1 Tax=Emticicia sp. BO119 TaxID=2757768 RepID=UPI0015EFE012|nr:PcfJ domain-containing protein [Emticicia sp. BO119]MBA4852577.1 PcfJ domain-containing protein [Emticicia sp. BO119]